MPTTKVKEDQYGLYVRHAGFLFRPLFPSGFDPNNPLVDIKADDIINITYKGVGASYAKLNIDGVIIYWMNHGSYIVPHDDTIKHLKSHECINQAFKNKSHA